MNCKEALQVLLDHVDYTSGACGLTEMVGGVLPKSIIDLCREAIKESAIPKEWKCQECGEANDPDNTECRRCSKNKV